MCICSHVYLNLTDLKSSEDTVCVYVVLGADKHGWRWDCGVTVIAGWMATDGQEQNVLQNYIRGVGTVGGKCNVS